MPVNINLLPDEVIARGVTPPNVSSLFDSYFTGQDRAQKQTEQNLFSGGLPRTPEGDIDYRQVAEMLARVQGAGAIGSLGGLRQGDIQQQALRQNENLPDIFPTLPAQPRVQFPPSVQRSSGTPQETSSLEPDQGGGEPARPGQANLTSDTEVPGSARMSVDGGPMMALASEPQPPTVRQFSQNPVTGPPTERFTPPPQQVAQARTPPPPGIAPPIPPVTDTNDPGYWTLENARAYDRAAYIFNMRAQNLGVGGLVGGVPGPKQQADQLAARAHEIYDHISKLGEQREKSQLEEKRVLPEAAAKAAISRLEKSQEKADTTAQGIAVTQDLVNQLNSRSGIFSGAWATEKLKLARFAEMLGFPVDPNQITNTQTFMSVMGQRVASGVKAFGSGTSITNQDREYVAKMVGGDITLDENSIRRILEITDKLNRGQIQKHNDDVDRIIKARPDARSQLEPFKVEMPPKIEGRTTQPKEKPPGVRPQTWTSSKGNTYQINPDGSLAPLAPR